MGSKKIRSMRELLKTNVPVLMPGAYDALSALSAEAAAVFLIIPSTACPRVILPSLTNLRY